MGNNYQQNNAEKAAAEKAAAEKAAAEQAAAEKAAAEKAAAEKAAKKDAVFAANPDLDVYYKTSDGTPFFTQNAAGLHAMGLKDKNVTRVTR
jgi:membrane protein involved in colicin uptake